MKIQESAENYLECILMLKNKKGSVRSIDIAHELNFTKPSVSVAMKNFRNNGYIVMDSDGYITLTEKGMSIAASTYERHLFLTNFFERIGVDPKVAADDACKIEHDLSEETFYRLKLFVKTLDENENDERDAACAN